MTTNNIIINKYSRMTANGLNTSNISTNLVNRWGYTISTIQFESTVNQLTRTYGWVMAPERVQRECEDLILDGLSTANMMSTPVNCSYLQRMAYEFMPRDFYDKFVKPVKQSTPEPQTRVHYSNRDSLIGQINEVKLVKSQQALFDAIIAGLTIDEICQKFELKNRKSFDKKLSRLVNTIQTKLGIDEIVQSLPPYVAPTHINTTEQLQRWHNTQVEQQVHTHTLKQVS